VGACGGGEVVHISEAVLLGSEVKGAVLEVGSKAGVGGAPEGEDEAGAGLNGGWGLAEELKTHIGTAGCAKLRTRGLDGAVRAVTYEHTAITRPNEDLASVVDVVNLRLWYTIAHEHGAPRDLFYHKITPFELTWQPFNPFTA
jgi:hypothetical protein